jgi:hypothetical protein
MGGGVRPSAWTSGGGVGRGRQWGGSDGREQATPCRASRGAQGTTDRCGNAQCGRRHLLTNRPGQHSIGGAVQTVLTGSNLNG